ncbi:T9SS type A sorting domain-containing protein [Winogradskyella aquimaris]|uniref:T9SS type A sorting domain-containing protein n=1 Tax=Winogradskyella aquimaris TaxID=864074 RepID=A0ABU5EIS9_9FLAO|nr:T9SS type A sorting domain-containing protein [Winogradskyella aquimaris]MDY2586225.1 T9SS type A sorting domain-containing protein [Winogradskyella aquimaris]
MKKQLLLLILILIPLINFSQVQIGQDIDGEFLADESGFAVSLSSNGKFLAISSIDNPGNGVSSGHVRVYENLNGVWIQVGQDIDGEAAGDWSGFSISLSSSGNVLAIGAVRNSGNGLLSGHARVFENVSGVWTQIGQDIDGENTDDQFGYAVSLSSNGNTLAVSSTRNFGNGAYSGHARVFENVNGVWTQIGQDIDGENSNDQSGYSLDLSSDGTKIAIGAFKNDGNGMDSGHVRVYENINGVWTQIGQDIDGELANDFFGRSLSISSDGNTIAVGATQNDDNGMDSGHVRVYENVNGVWTQIGQDIDGEAAVDISGYSISLSSDGSIIAIGAPLNDDNGVDSGHTRVYKNISGIWTQIGQDIDGEAADDRSGYSVSLSSNGETLAVGAIGNDGNLINSGHVRVYDLSESLTIQDQVILDFNLYPNPARTHFTIQMKNNSELNSISIYNYLGQLVLTSEERMIDTTELASGLYIVEVETTKGKSTKKLIIK